MNHNNAHMAHAAADDVADMMIMLMKMVVDEDVSDEDDDNESPRQGHLWWRDWGQINIHNTHVIKMILMCLVPGAEEDKKHQRCHIKLPLLIWKGTPYTI